MEYQIVVARYNEDILYLSLFKNEEKWESLEVWRGRVRLFNFNLLL